MLQSRFKMPSREELKKRMDNIPDNIMKECPVCDSTFFSMRAGKQRTCPNCGFGFRITAKRRAKITFDSFEELDSDVTVPKQYTCLLYTSPSPRDTR
mgnify:CR=1 FL=1